MNKKVIVLAVVVLAAVAGALWIRQAPGGIVSADAVVEGRIAAVAAGASGTVKEVYVKAGDAVAQGQPLLALETSGFERQLAQERMRLAELASQLPPALLVPSPTGNRPAPGKPLAALRSDEEEARRRVETAAHAYAAANLAFSRLDAGQGAEYAKPDPRRQASLIARDEAAISLKKAREAHETASYARAQREMQEKAERQSGPVSAALAARIAEYQLQISRVRLAEDTLASAVLTAPENGKVLLLTVQPGNAVTAGDTPVAIVPEEKGDLWVFAFFDKADADKLVPGSACAVTLKSSGAEARGTIARLLPEQGTEKSVAVHVVLDQDGLPAEFTTGEAVSVTVQAGGNPLAAFWDTIKGLTNKN